MNDNLYNLAKKIDDINYDYDTYSYTKEIYIDLIEGNTSHYIEFLKDIIADVEVMEGYSMEHVQEVLKELEEV